MRRGATKEKIIRTTQELITRNGIRAVRVDEIAQTLGISKRTLYELFADKTDLVNTCLSEMTRSQQQRITLCCRRRSGNPLQKALRIVGEYINDLYTVDNRFLVDFHCSTFAEQLTDNRVFWTHELTQMLTQSCEQGLVLAEIDAAGFAERVINTLSKLRQTHVTHDELRLFSRTILRGAATQKGIKLIDRKV